MSIARALFHRAHLLEIQDVFGLFTDEGVADKRSDVIVFPQVRASRTRCFDQTSPRCIPSYDLRTPGQGTEFYS